MDIEIIELGNEYTIVLEGVFFRHCKTYSELSQTMGGLVKSKFLRDFTGRI